MTTPQPPIVEWNAPDTVPEVKLGTEKLFWIAVKAEWNEAPQVFTALYQKRPVIIDDDGELTLGCDNWVLHSPDGDYVDSVGWVENKTTSEFDDYFEAFSFNEHYMLLGWAEYQAPEFTGVTANVA